MIKVLGVINHNNLGGAQKAMSKLKASYESDAKVTFDIVYLYQAKGSEHTASNGAILTKNATILKYVIAPFKLFRYLKYSNPDVIISFLPLSNIIAPICGWLAGVEKRIISHRNPVSSYNKLLKTLDRYTGSSFLVSKIVCNSNAVKTSIFQYPKAYKSKVTIINNCVEPFSNSSPSEFIVNLAKEYSDSINIVTVGRLATQKNYEFALEVLSELPQAVLHIAGHGELFDSLDKLGTELGVRKRVNFLGNVGHLDIQHLLQFCDMYLQTSTFEGQSNSLLEAICAKCVIVSSDIPPQREVLVSTDGALQAGVLVSLDLSAKQWAKEINKLLGDEVKMESLRKAAGLRSLDFSIESYSNEFKKVFFENG